MRFCKDIEAFIKDYAREIEEENAAIFAGAGLSVSTGYVNWKELLRSIADGIGLSVDKEPDLVAVAQFHANEAGNRSQLNRTLINEFCADLELTENHRILARLPISTYWTTNYDKLIEKALEEAGKRPDIKHTAGQLSNTVPGRAAVVFKMHGDAEHPENAILTKEDYEKYYLTNEAFLTALAGALVSKSFLFLGFSFTDPNLDYVLSRIRANHAPNMKQHYAVLKRIQRNDFKSDAEFDYAKRRQELFVGDLKRFSIKVLLVDDYADITKLLQRLLDTIRRKSILISGAAHEYGIWDQTFAERFVADVARRLVAKDCRIISGFGIGVGSSVIEGALAEIYRNKNKSVEKSLILRPFPQNLDEEDRATVWTTYREDLVSQAGVAIFLFGNKLVGGKIQTSDGMRQEFDLAHANCVPVIPVGVTGYAAEELWNEVADNFSKFFPENPELEKIFLSLGDDKRNEEQHAEAICEILDALSG